MYTDWTAVILLLFTAVPLAIVVAVTRNDQHSAGERPVTVEGSQAKS